MWISRRRQLPPELQHPKRGNLAGEPCQPRVVASAFSSARLPVPSSRRFIEIQPPVDNDDREPPPEGVLFLSVSGDRKRLERREHAQSLIASAECPMPQLGLLLEGAVVPERRRKTEAAMSAAARAIFGGEPTARQVEALRVALNTPDIALIQGPPGTGKTKTIAALEARLAELSKDADFSGQTLLTSYQHDAVENAASETLVFGLPAIKVGRKRGTTDDSDGFDRWRRERIDAVRADLAALPERPVSEVLRRVRSIAAAYVSSPGPCRRVPSVVAGHRRAPPVPFSRRAQRPHLGARPRTRRASATCDDATNDERTLALQAVRGLRVDATRSQTTGLGTPGGSRTAGVTRHARRRGGGILHDAAAWTRDDPPPFLST